MGGIPHDPDCSICEQVRLKPSKAEIAVLTEATSAWCATHGRKLFAPQCDPSISFTVCSKFKSVYRLAEKGKAWPPPPDTQGDHEHLWLNRPSNVAPYWIFKPFIRFEELPKVDPEAGDPVNS